MNFEEAWPLIDSIPGWMSEDECRFLFESARDCTAKGVILEIGAYLGRSTSALCLGSLASTPPNFAVLVYTVDPFTAYNSKRPKHQLRPGPNWTYPQFIEHMRRLNLMSVIRPMKMTSAEAITNWDTQIKMLFIDGNHDYQYVRQDFDAWTPHVTPGGIIALHDTVTWPGPKKVVEEEWKDKEIIRFGEIGALHKV